MYVYMYICIYRKRTEVSFDDRHASGRSVVEDQLESTLTSGQLDRPDHVFEHGHLVGVAGQIRVDDDQSAATAPQLPNRALVIVPQSIQQSGHDAGQQLGHDRARAIEGGIEFARLRRAVQAEQHGQQVAVRERRLQRLETVENQIRAVSKLFD
ncbi:conserved hypothetical protein [Trichinella spiralis]|uniref:hypothetical protein n=1 Tax=Trichinella spiralis TaxID=6334 RepID=UPI0001EFB9A0|nr:conserved hypothetical protein [Trichinella spiralis]